MPQSPNTAQVPPDQAIQTLVEQIRTALPALQKAVTQAADQSQALAVAKNELSGLQEQLRALNGLIRDGTPGQTPLLERVISLQTIVTSLKNKCDSCKAPEELARLQTEVSELHRLVADLDIVTDFQEIRDRLTAIETELKEKDKARFSMSQWLQILIPLILTNLLTFFCANYTLQKKEQQDVSALHSLIRSTVNETLKAHALQPHNLSTSPIRTP